MDEAFKNGNSNLQLTSIKASFEPDWLVNMLFFNKFGDNLATETVTYAVIKKALLEIQGRDDLTANELLKEIKVRLH